MPRTRRRRVGPPATSFGILAGNTCSGPSICFRRYPQWAEPNVGNAQRLHAGLQSSLQAAARMGRRDRVSSRESVGVADISSLRNVAVTRALFVHEDAEFLSVQAGCFHTRFL